MALVVVVTSSLWSNSNAQASEDRIRLNQVGVYPDGPKIAVVVDAPEGPFHLIDATSGQVAYSAELGALRNWQWSGEQVRRADFTEFEESGVYFLEVPGVGFSHPITIGNEVYREVARGSLKALYFQRASTPLPPEHAGAWARPAGHPDDQVIVHPSAASPSRPAGTNIDAPGGWYDAGDYNKYVVPAAFTSYVMLAALEHYPEYFDLLVTDIPESGNGVPDVVNEAVWNLRWMMKMQDPEDGGLYHKLTNANFDGTVAPHAATSPRYVVQKSTAATLDFAAAAAQASRVLQAYPDVYPGLADSSLSAALLAWEWARANPSVRYIQNTINQQFNPNINTGEYGDGNVADEFAWAAIELYTTTGQDSFHQAVPVFVNNSTPGWASVNMLGYMTLARLEVPTAAGEALREQAVQRMTIEAMAYRNEYLNSAFATAIGRSQGNFGWGSAGGAAGIGMVLVQAYETSGDASYRETAMSVLDYLLGRNGTGYSFLGAYGSRTPIRPHHRPSESDQVDAPVPGMLSGGPNPGQQDNCTYPSNLPASSFVDSYCSYASNEITTYWNAPLIYLAGALEATKGNLPTPTAPPHLLLPLPVASSVPQFVPLRWSATEPYSSYSIQVFHGQDWSEPVFEERDVRQMGTLARFSSSGKHYWRVQGEGPGIEEDWSIIGSFTYTVAEQVLAYQEEEGMVVIEAENRSGTVAGASSAQWDFWRSRGVNNPDPNQRSVGQTAYGGPNVGMVWGDDFRFESPMVYYNVHFSSAGSYYPWMRIWASDDTNDGHHVGLDGVPVTTGDPLQLQDGFGEWTWTNTKASGERAVIDVLRGGVYTFSIWLQEDGVMIDRFLLTTDPDFEPAGQGPAESVRGVGTSVDEVPIVHGPEIRSVYPNPFRDDGAVQFRIPQPLHVRLAVYDILGRRVAALLDGTMSAGSHDVRFDAAGWASGVYIFRLETGAGAVTRMSLLNR